MQGRPRAHRVTRASRASRAFCAPRSASAAAFALLGGTLGALAAAASLPSAARADAIVLTNPGFETGTSAGWTVQNAPLGGGVNVLTRYTSAAGQTVTFLPKEGSFFALLDPGQTGVYTMLSQPFTAVPGQKISGWAFFKANDLLPFNDDGQVRIIDAATGAAVTVFNASVSSVGSFGTTGWRAWEYTVPAEGTYRIEARVANRVNSGFDSVLGLDGVTLSAPPNRPPSADPGPAYTVIEGDSVLLVGGGSDPDGDPLSFAWDLDGDGTFETAGREATFSAADLDGPTSRTVSLRVSDGRENGDVTASVVVNVVNAAPKVSITGPGSGALFAVNTPVSFAGLVADAGVADTFSATWTLSTTVNGLPVTDTFAGSLAADRSISGSYTFSEPGVYSVSLSASDDDGDTGTATVLTDPAAGELPAFVVVYDPSAGFVTGGGWLDSPAGALSSDPLATGKACFGFVSRYRRGASVPSGATEFRFRAGDLHFSSRSYEYMVISGARVQYKGVGQINCQGDYGFLLTAVDGRLLGTGQKDRLRIQVWDRTTGAVVYDNQPGASDTAELAGDGTLIDGGAVVIHAR